MPKPTYEPTWPLDRLTPAPDNPRRELGDLTELAESIAGVGIVEPLVTTTSSTIEDGQLLLVCGHRRHAAAIKAGLSHVPVVVHQGLDDSTRVEAMITENVARSNLLPTEEAAAYEQLVSLGRKQRDIAKKLGVSQPQVSRRLALLRLPDPAREAVDNGGIKIDDAVKLAGLPAGDVTKLFKGGAPTEWDINNVVRRHETAKAVEAAKARAEKEGLRIVDAGVCGYNQPGAHLWHLDWVDEKAHAAEPCHAFVITRDGKLDPVCTDKALHPAPEHQEQDDDDLPARARRGMSEEERAEWERRRAETEARQEAWKTQAERRQEACRFLLTQAPGGIATAHLLALSLSLRAPFDGLPWERAADILSLTVETEENDWDHNAERRALAGLAHDGDGTHVALALALAWGEEAMFSPTHKPDPNDEDDAERLSLLRLYLHHLAGDGDYHPAEWELAWMDETQLAPEPLDELRARAIAAAVTGKDDPGERSALESLIAEMENPYDLRAIADARRCRACGCTDTMGCDEGCSWVEADLCSSCVAVTAAGDLPEVNITKRGNKWITVCADCKEELGRNTTEAYAQECRKSHLEVVHGTMPAVAS